MNALLALMLIVAFGAVGRIGRIHAASPSQHLVGVVSEVDEVTVTYFPARVPHTAERVDVW